MQPLNSPIELGVRSLVVLAATFPGELDLSRLVLLDHCLLHSADMDGPQSVHPAVPSRAGELGFKRTAIERGLQVVIRAGLVDVHATDEGITYRASEDAVPFLRLLKAQHLAVLQTAAQWVAHEFGDLPESALRDRMIAELGRWGEEFSESSEIALLDRWEED
jgi:hypothetical protein